MRRHTLYALTLLLALGAGTTAVSQSTNDADGDGLTNAHEAAIGTDPQRADTDGDGYTDYQELFDPRLKNPPADYKPSGVTGADPLRKDVFLELDYMKPKRWWFIRYHGHKPEGGVLRQLVDRFRARGINLFVVVDDGIDHENETSRAEMIQLRNAKRDYPIYYWGLFADKRQDSGLGRHGNAWYGTNDFVIFDGNFYMRRPMEGGTTLHELAHLMIDTYPENPLASHLMDRPSVQNDGAHCPYACVLNKLTNQSLDDQIAQIRRFDLDSRCWNAIRGFYDRP